MGLDAALAFPENFTNVLLSTIFPEPNPAIGLTMLVVFFLTGFLAMVYFFYFSDRRNVWLEMRWSEKITFSMLFGSIAITCVAVIFYVLDSFDSIKPLMDPLLINGSMMSIMGFSCFLLFICLCLGDKFGRSGRYFLGYTLFLLISFLLAVVFPIIIIAESIKTGNYHSLLTLLPWIFILYIIIKRILKDSKK